VGERIRLAFFHNTVYDYAPGRNRESKQEVAEMAIREITMRLPEELLQSFDKVIERQSLTRDEALIRLVEDYVQRRAVEREIAKATLARLGREMPTNRSIDDIEIDADKVAKAIAETFGTDDPLKIVDMVRNRYDLH
jgi:hypothetical protein